MSETTDLIKDKLDIVDVVREYVPGLKKAGANWKAPCPFHNEKTASFMVSQEKGIWHCFGCGKGGDVFGFVKEAEGVEFPDALRILAQKAGVKLEKQNLKQETERQRVLAILKTASLWYNKALISAKSGQVARDYVVERKISDATRDEWKIGFAPDLWEGVSKYLKTRGFTQEEIARAGLISRNQTGSYYERFKNRLMFPITDVHGSVVGFTARKLNKDDFGGKYINTPETLVYHKGSVLFGLSLAKQFIKSEDLAVVVEGNMDCVSSHQAGVKNVVASSGTALTEDQVRLLKRFTKNICLAFDPDFAGQEALARGMEIAWKEDMTIKIIKLPQGMDPDDLIKKDSNEWRKAISGATDFMDWVIKRCEEKFDLSSASGKKDCAKITLSWISRLPDMIIQTHYLQVLSRKINVEESVLRSAILKSKPDAKPYSKASNTKEEKIKDSQNIEDKIIKRILVLMVLDKTKELIREDFFVKAEYLELYNSLDKLYDGDVEYFSDNAQILAREILLSSCEEGQKSNKESRFSEIKILVKRLEDYFFKKQFDRLKFELKSCEEKGDDEQTSRIMTELKDLSKKYAKEKNQES